MTTTQTPADFLLARIADDEKRFHYGCPGSGEYAGCDTQSDWTEHALAAIRRVVERAAVECICTTHGHDRAQDCPQCVACHAVTIADGYVLADFAAVYADHPDYRDEWRP